MSKSDRSLGVIHGLSVLLSLTEDGTELQLELALHMHLLHSLRNTHIFEKVGFFDDLNGLLKIDDTLFKHS